MAAKKKTNNPGSTGEILEATLLVSMFRESIEMNAKLTTQMGTICGCLKENTGSTNKLLNHLGGMPTCLKKIKGTVSLVKWGLLPIVLSLIGLVVFFATK